MLRYSLGSLFLVLLYLSIGCAALVNASGVWPQVAITLTLAILILFSLGAIFWTERRRIFAIGFSATGWLYFLLVFSNVTNVRPYLLTESATNQLFITMHSKQLGPKIVYQTVTTATGPASSQTYVFPTPVLSGPRPASSNPAAPVYSAPVAYAPVYSSQYSAVPVVGQYVNPQSFGNIGHSLWTVIVAFVGGVTAQLLAKGREQANAAKREEK
jgi:hypothetical protein